MCFNDVEDLSREGVAYAQASRSLSAQNDVVCPYADKYMRARCAIAGGDVEGLIVVLHAIGCDDFNGQDIFKTVRFEQGQNLGLVGDGEEVAVREYLPAIEHDDLSSELQDFANGVADVEHGDAQVRADVAQIGHDAVFEFLIERGQGFIHDEQSGRSQDGAAQGDALAFTA